MNRGKIGDTRKSIEFAHIDSSRKIFYIYILWNLRE